MKKLVLILTVILALLLFGCDGEILPESVEPAAKAAENAITTLLESIDWEELKGYAEKGYEALTERFPALKGENIKAFLKENGLSLLNKYMESTDAETQENARKLGDILKILYPDLTDEVNAVLPEEEPVS